MKTNVKENDVFTWRYSDKYIDSLSYKSDLYHCKERLAVAININNDLMLFDTFWGIGRKDNYAIKLNDIGEKYIVEFYCNLDDLEKKERHSQIDKYYDDEDIFTLHDQHACAESCIYRYLKKGAKKSKKKMIKILENEISKLEHDIDWKKRQIETANKNLKEVKSGNLDVYI